MNLIRFFLLGFALLIVGCTVAFVPEADSLGISGAWVRPAETMSAAYLQISNNGRNVVRLERIETTAAAAVELHETIMENDVMRMRPVDAIRIPAGDTVQLEPMGRHAMLLDLSAPLTLGETILLTLHFDNGVSVKTTARVSDTPVTLPADGLTQRAVTAVAAGIFLGDILNPPVPVQDFSLPGSRDDISRFSDLNGSWRVIFFGYMRCPDFCPLTLVDYKQTRAMLGDAAADVTFVFISVDAARDKPAALRDYLANFDPTFVGFSADDVTLSRIQPDYGFYYERRLDSGPNAVYSIDHSTRSYLVDPNGVLRATFAYDTDPQALAAALEWLHRHPLIFEKFNKLQDDCFSMTPIPPAASPA